jgi:PhnB protein
MAERALADRVNEIVDLIVSRGDATGALRDPEMAPLARIAAELRHCATPDFKARLRASLQRRTKMTSSMTIDAVREGFTTVTPYIRVASEGLVAFLATAFGASETFAARGGGGGMHREVRIGNSMVMIGEGPDAGGTMPIGTMAFHVFVDDVDAAFARAVAAGANAMGAPEDRHYGERAGFVTDPFGNHWYIASPLGPDSLANALRTVTPALFATSAADYIAFLERALGAVEEMRAGDAEHVRYARLRIGDAAIELGDGAPMPGAFMLYVTDPDERYERAVAAGATSIMTPSDQPYGRIGGVRDFVGNQWFFSRPAR